MSELRSNYLDLTKLAVAGFLAPYREPTLTAYRTRLALLLALARYARKLT